MTGQRQWPAALPSHEVRSRRDSTRAEFAISRVRDPARDRGRLERETGGHFRRESGGRACVQGIARGHDVLPFEPESAVGHSRMTARGLRRHRDVVASRSVAFDASAGDARRVRRAASRGAIGADAREDVGALEHSRDVAKGSSSSHGRLEHARDVA